MENKKTKSRAVRYRLKTEVGKVNITAAELYELKYLLDTMADIVDSMLGISKENREKRSIVMK